MNDIITELFENISIIITMFPPVVVVPAVLILLIIKKSKNKNKLKKRCFLGVIAFTAVSLLSEIFLYTNAINAIEKLADTLGGYFFVLFYYAIQAFCFISGITLLVAYIVLAVREKKHLVSETEVIVKTEFSVRKIGLFLSVMIITCLTILLHFCL